MGSAIKQGSLPSLRQHQLHCDPTSGKVKFLQTGRWKVSLTMEDLPVQYIALSENTLG